jgi:hypothetical protein
MLSFFWIVGRSFLIFFILMKVGYCAIGFPFNSCAVHVAQYEKQHKIPTGLLHAISKAESGRKDDTGHIVAWPWTVNAEGQGYYFATKEEAIRAVKNMQQKGIQSIDVGCMQINLYYHPNAFKSLADAFDPVQNVAYAAQFLTGLKNEHASWHIAVAHYHSANPVHHIPYRENVLNIWDRDIKNGSVSLAAGVFETTRSSNFFPQVSRIRRLMSIKTLRLKRSQVVFNASHQGTVRKVTRHSSHIRRAKMIRKPTS